MSFEGISCVAIKKDLVKTRSYKSLGWGGWMRVDKIVKPCIHKINNLVKYFLGRKSKSISTSY